MFKRLNQLEKVHKKGWLNFGDKRISPLDRLQAGRRLWMDFTKSAFPHPQAVDFDAIRVDGGNMKEMPESVAMARQRLNQAIKAVPDYREWFVVREIAIYDRKVGIRKTSSADYNHEMELLKEDLCRGLDKLAWHYGLSVFKPRIVSYICPDAEIADTPRRYEIEL